MVSLLLSYTATLEVVAKRNAGITGRGDYLAGGGIDIRPMEQLLNGETGDTWH